MVDCGSRLRQRHNGSCGSALTEVSSASQGADAMRPISIAIAVITLTLLVSWDGQEGTMPAEFAEHIDSLSEAVEYRDVAPYNLDYRSDPSKAPPNVCPKLFSNAEAMADIDMVIYLLTTAYGKSDYWEKKGMDFLELGRQAKEKLNTVERQITLVELENTIHAILKSIRDGHVELWGTILPFQPYEHRDAYFSDVLLAAGSSGAYRAIDSRVPGIVKGDRFTEAGPNSHLFRTLSPADKPHYLIGILSEEDVDEMTLSFGGKDVAIPFHKCRIRNAKLARPDILHVEETREVKVVSISSFSSEYRAELSRLVTLGKQLQKESRFILSLYDNSGGTSVYPEMFIRSLNGYADWRGTCSAKLWSPATIQFYLSTGPFTRDVIAYVQFSQKNKTRFRDAPTREWTLHPYQGDRNRRGSYQGTMVVLVNRNVGSAAESAVTLSRTIGRTILVGENTRGAGSSGEMVMFYLPNSRMVLSLPTKSIIVDGCEEGTGFLPDYWLDSPDPIAEITRWFDDPVNYQFEF